MVGCIYFLGETGAVEPPPAPATKSTSAVVRKAEAEFKESLAAAEQEFSLKVRQCQSVLRAKLEKAKDAATKAGALDEAVALRDRISLLADSTQASQQKGPSQVRDKLGEEVADFVWTGSPNWGRFVLKADGTVQCEKMPDKITRWGPINEGSVCITEGDGHVSVLVFDMERRSVKAYYLGKLDKSGWTATRSNPK
ncbi:MAG: hypothetical protein C0478_11395 [Planctomyces sp.]|nr:hypothetical protein [Planctomyces sp.]